MLCHCIEWKNGGLAGFAGLSPHYRVDNSMEVINANDTGVVRIRRLSTRLSRLEPFIFCKAKREWYSMEFLPQAAKPNSNGIQPSHLFGAERQNPVGGGPQGGAFTQTGH